MNGKSAIKTLEKFGAVLKDGHFVYTSGRHGSVYVNKDAIYPHTQTIAQLCGEIAAHFSQDGIEVVLGPAMGGIILCQWVAFHLSKLCSREVLAVYADKTNENSFIIRRGYDNLIRRKKLLLVEDVLTTGDSARKVAEQARKNGAEIIGLGAICNRGQVSGEKMGVGKLFSIIQLPLESWPADECPLCKRGVSINQSVGKYEKPLSS